MNLFDVRTWDDEEMREAEKFLSVWPVVDDIPVEMGNLADTAQWVRNAAHDYFKSELYGDERQLEPKPFRISDGFKFDAHYIHTRRGIEAAKFDCGQRLCWLEGTADEELIERFGLLSTVPRWVVQAAMLNIKQLHKNLQGAQREMPDSVRQVFNSKEETK